MRALLTSGLMLLVMCSCKTFTIKEPVPMYIVNSDLMATAYGEKDFNLNHDPDKVGEWTSGPMFTKNEEAPVNLMCFSLEYWLTRFKPKLKEGAQANRDAKD